MGDQTPEFEVEEGMTLVYIPGSDIPAPWDTEEYEANPEWVRSQIKKNREAVSKVSGDDPALADELLGNETIPEDEELR